MFRSFPVNQTTKNNILDVVNLTFNFQTSINYQIQAPPPFNNDVHVDIAAELTRIRAQTYASDFDFHVDLSSTIKRLQDGHTVYINLCFDSLFLNFLPIPVVLLNNAEGKQQLHISPEAFEVASAEFADEIGFWESATHLNLSQVRAVLPFGIQSYIIYHLISYRERQYWQSMTRIHSLQLMQTPISPVASKLTPLGRTSKCRHFRIYDVIYGLCLIRFFSSYLLSDAGWAYRMGDFAQQSLPLTDSVTLTVKIVGSKAAQRITVSACISILICFLIQFPSSASLPCTH